MQKRIWIINVILLTGAVFVFTGCKKEEPSPSVVQTQTEVQESADEQTTCPVMGGPIDKEIFVEYQDKKVYFCCASCKGEFEKDPEKYISKLPQFNK